MLLAIDTSTTLTGIACYDESGLLGECTWYSDRNHTAQVLPQVHLLFEHLRRSPANLQAVAVALGPGSWSGLRVGLSMAKGLSVAGGLALIGVGTLDALAYQHQRPFMPIFPIIRLGRSRFATAEFLSANEWQRLSDYRNVTLQELCASVTDHALFCGDIDAEMQEQISTSVSVQTYFPSAPAALRRAGFLASLGWERFVANDWDDIASLEPIYLGEPLKEKKQEE